MKNIYRKTLLTTACVILLPLSARSEIREGSIELSPFVGYNFFENDQNLKDDLLVGGRIGYNFTRHFGVEGVVEYIPTNVDDRSLMITGEGQFSGRMDDVDLTFYHLDAVYHFIPKGNINPFVVLGYGGANYSPNISHGNMSAFNVGLGSKFFISERVAIRVDVRDYMVTEIFQETYNNFAATVGLTFVFGGKDKAAPVRVAKAEPKPEPKPEPIVEKPEVILVSEPEAEEKVKVVAVKAKVVILAFEDIHFDFDKAALKPEAKEILKRNIKILKKNPKAQIRIAGYTSALGTKEYNYDLSVRRAKAVEDYLVEVGYVRPGRLTTIGFGETRPTAYEDTPEELYSKEAKANMRVLFQVIVK